MENTTFFNNTNLIQKQQEDFLSLENLEGIFTIKYLYIVYIFIYINIIIIKNIEELLV